MMLCARAYSDGKVNVIIFIITYLINSRKVNEERQMFNVIQQPLIRNRNKKSYGARDRGRQRKWERKK